tara:strand:+ start:126 stop:1100 length:975 start_codon:yes stop_codon:yes gene_type:complete
MATFTYESIKNRFKNPTVDGNLHLDDDGAILKIGADSDIQLTHSGSAGTMTILNGFTIDIVDDLVIDVDGGDVVLKDGGTQFGKLTGSSNELVITSGDDAMLTGADGGAATFASTLAVTGVLTADAGINVDDITIDGTAIALSTGSLSINATATDAAITLDAAGDITLDADGGDIFLKDDGTTFGEFTNSSTDFVIKSTTSDKDIIFKGNDGGNVVTALTLDMSAAGAATFNNDVTAFSDMRLKTDIRTIDNALNRVCDLRGVFFTREGAAGTGVIAQEVQNILPEVVHTNQEYLSVAYGNMVGVLIEAIKELREEVKSLKESS